MLQEFWKKNWLKELQGHGKKLSFLARLQFSAEELLL